MKAHRSLTMRGGLVAFLAAFSMAVFPPSLRAKDVPVTYDIVFSSQGAKIGADAEIRIANIQAAGPWRTGAIQITAVDASKEVNADSDARSVTIQRETAIAFSNEPKIFSVPLKVSAAGEFGLRLEVRVTGTDGRTLALTTAVSVLAEDGQVWFGLGSISSAAANRILVRSGNVQFKPGDPEIPPVARAEIQRWAEERQRKQLENKNRQAK